ncbi:PE family protein, partial [Mycobacterium ulcerans]|nr:PE family protein [Mycobacterium ulcerans]MEB4033661.1 PE family protein [Mycobacterium ulcerans]MEB4058496.1 PE family protein [Mycobacterium ulcerans]MEB4249659.1 PE family protein [Mycobacterium ulcerans]MEB4422563.1 PE family protein [Mycobacterium ulcerans]
MSYLAIAPEIVAAAAADMDGIGSPITAANAAAAIPTSAIAAAAADEISAAIAELFGNHAQQYQALSAQMARFHDQFVRSLSGAAQTYARAEATGAAPLQPVLDLINGPTQALLGRPLIGNGTSGALGTGQAGGDGGLLIGNGTSGALGTGQAGGDGGLLIGNGTSGALGTGQAGGDGGLLIGNGTSGALGTGQAGGDGGLLIGNGTSGALGTGQAGGDGGLLIGN